MADSSNPKPSSLDPELLRILEAAQSGMPSPLLDDDPLVDSSLFDDNAPLVPVAPPSALRPEPPSPTPFSPATIAEVIEEALDDISIEIEELGGFAGPAETAQSPAAVETASAPVDEGTLAERWFEDEPPLTQALLDGLYEDAEHRRELAPPEHDSGNSTPESYSAPEPPAPSSEIDSRDTPMSQVGLDALFSEQTPPDESSVPIVDDSPMSQADLDALLAGQAPAVESSTTFEDDAPLTQAMLDEMFEAAEQRRALAELEALSGATAPDLDAEPVLSATAPDPEEPDAPMSQAELDALLAGQTPTAEIGAPVEDDAPMSQAELDALLAGQTPAAEISAPVEDDAPMSQAELDALLAGQTPAAEISAPVEDDAPMSQAELDALLAGQTPAAEISAPVEDDAPMSQAELDALLAGQTSTVVPTADFSDDAPLSQDDLDALVRGLDSVAQIEPETTRQVDGPLSQVDLEALLGDLGFNTAPPVTEATTGGGSLSQDDLDDLLGSLENQAASGPAITPDHSGSLTQADLDALLASQPAAPEGRHAIPQEDLDALLDAASGKNTTPPPGSTAADRPVALTQDDLDALINAASGGVPTSPTAGSSTAVRSLDLSQDDLDALLAGAATSSPDDRTVSSLSDDDLDSLFDKVTGAPLLNADDGPLDQTNIDALLSGRGEEQVLDSSALDAPILSPGGAYDDDVSLSQSSIDSLMADLDSGGALSGGLAATDSPITEAAGDDDDELSEISQDMIDSLIANAQAQSTGSAAPASTSEIGSENFAAAATASDSGPELLSQSDLDRLIEESRQQDRARGQAKQRALEEAISAAQVATRSPAAPDLLSEIQAREKPVREPSAIMAFVRENAARIAASLLIGGLATLSTGVLLHLNRQIIMEDVRPQAGSELEVALERAREEVARGDYPSAIAELEIPVARSMPGATRNDALYVLLEAKYRANRGEYGSDEFDQLSALIEETVAQAPAHARAPEALGWRAEMFKSDAPQTALDIYKKIFDQYAEAPGLDKMLIDASKLALAQQDPLTSAIYAQDLLRRFPSSPWAGEAILAVGDANLIAGNESDARSTFVRIAESEPDSGLGAQAFLRLGKLAYDTGQYDQAIMQLAKRLETTTTTEGNDEVYLLLAQSYRKAGKLNEARDTLNDLLNIFEPGPVTPRAYVEYSQVLESLGEREKAVKTAQRASMEFPANPEVQRNTGELLGLSGNPLAAATSLIAADDAGAADPNLVLTAARYYRTANMPDEAEKAYARLKANYGGSQAALAGGIEAAQLRYSQGDAEGALDDLEALQAATRGTEHRLSALQAMQEIYQDLGLSDHVKTMGKEIAQQASSPVILASTAINLIDAGDLESAQNAIEKIDFSLLPSPIAFNLLMKEGLALLAVAPQRGLEKLEEAHFNYPEARTREADHLLLQTYLSTGRPAAARRLVMELKAAVASKPSDTPYLVDAAIAWGDYLYDKEDYRTAEFAYAMAEEAGLKPAETVSGIRSHPDWARYQRANALLRLADYEGCVALYDKIATSDSTWAGEAAVKAGLARLEQRQRGIEMPPPPEKTARAG